MLSNVNNCLELTRAELDLKILANVQAVAKIDLVAEKRKERTRCSFLFQNIKLDKGSYLEDSLSIMRSTRDSDCILHG